MSWITCMLHIPGPLCAMLGYATFWLMTENKRTGPVVMGWSYKDMQEHH